MEHPATTVKPVTGCSVKLAFPVSSLLAFARVIPGKGIKCPPLHRFNKNKEYFPLSGCSVTLLMNNEPLQSEV